MSSRTPSRTRKIVIRVITLVLALLICGVLYDLYFPRTTHMREFDPDEVARLETAMWRSYYEKQRLRLFNQLSELLRTQYHMPLVRSNTTAYYAANAAFVFKQGRQRADYEKALPDLVKFYSAIRQMSDIPFDVDRTAGWNSSGGSFIVSARSIRRAIWTRPWRNCRLRFIACRRI